jgi:hypothetical protein
MFGVLAPLPTLLTDEAELAFMLFEYEGGGEEAPPAAPLLVSCFCCLSSKGLVEAVPVVAARSICWSSYSDVSVESVK